MRTVIIIGVVLIALIAIIWLVKQYVVRGAVDERVERPSQQHEVAEQYVVRISDVPAILQQLQEQGSNGAFAVFMFSDHGKPGEKNIINLQFSIENGKVGLDWVLLAPVNVRDGQRIFDFLKARDSKPRRITQNGVTYLRAEDGDLAQLCQHIMSELYGVKKDDGMDFLPEGFKWKP